MSFKNLNFEISYNSDKDDILNQFYIPALSEAVSYKRIGGYFSSAAFALAARGLSKFILNGGHMQLLVNHVLQEKDKDVIEQITYKPEYIENILKESFNTWDLENEIIKNHVMVFGWMLVNKLLDLKIAVTMEPEIFHQKVGIMADNEYNKLSFSGSNNETVMGWKSNIEEFKVFRNWVPEQDKYLQSDEEKFDNFWSGKSSRFTVVDVPTAVKKQLISIAPKNLEDISIDDGKISQLFRSNETNLHPELKERHIELHDFQKMAVKNWLEAGYKGILEMATGTGKTFTAFGCLNQAYKKSKKILVVISVPYRHLLKQWETELHKIIDGGQKQTFGELWDIRLDDILMLGSVNQNWKRKLANKLLDFESGLIDTIIVLCTHDTLCNPTTIEKISKINNEILLIADEVHGVGADKRVSGLLSNYSMRLGLSATPERWFDEEGTKKISKFFGGSVFEFTIKDAINTINPSTGRSFLTPYDYLPEFVELTKDEKEQYLDLSKKISRSFAISKGGTKLTTGQTILLNQRANVVKSAENKIGVLSEILQSLSSKYKTINQTLIYCNPGKQFQAARSLLDNMKLKVKNFTNQEGTTPKEAYGGLTEREYIIKNFSEGFYQVLLAMKCLDEGVDIPSAKYGILMASTSNPREFIQRRGRLLRYFPGKDKSVIFDIIVLPPRFEGEDKALNEMDRVVYKKEMLRYKEFATIADNSGQCLIKLARAEEHFYNYA